MRTNFVVLFLVVTESSLFLFPYKLSRRNVALEKVPGWDSHKKGIVAEILREDAMSSEESRAESDEEGTRRITCYKVRHLPWESNRLKKIKKKMDREYVRTISERAKSRILWREEALLPSKRACPFGEFPEWAIKEAYRSLSHEWMDWSSLVGHESSIKD